MTLLTPSSNLSSRRRPCEQTLPASSRAELQHRRRLGSCAGGFWTWAACLAVCRALCWWPVARILAGQVPASTRQLCSVCSFTRVVGCWRAAEWTLAPCLSDHAMLILDVLPGLVEC